MSPEIELIKIVNEYISLLPIDQRNAKEQEILDRCDDILRSQKIVFPKCGIHGDET